MAYRSDPSLVVLHALKVKGFAEVAALAEATGFAPADIDQHLAAATEANLAVRREGRVSGWALTADGRGRHTAMLEADLDASGAHDVLVAAYALFGPVNVRFKKVCTDWQLRAVDGSQVPNDHSDQEYDRAVIAALHGIDDDTQSICAGIGEALERMARYSARLSRALARLEGGDHGAFTRPLADSYHDIWMELHEDLISTLKVARTAADA